MKSGILLCSLLTLVSLFSVSLNAETSVWKVKQGVNHLFIGGTVHVLAEADYPLPAEYNRAYQLSERLVLETDMQKLQSPKFQQTMLRRLTYSDGRNLKSVLSAETFQALDQYCTSRGITIANLLPFKPGMVAITLTVFEFSVSLYAETSVWKVKQGANHLFIGGMVHVLAEADYPLPAEYNRAYQLSDRLVLES